MAKWIVRKAQDKNPQLTVWFSWREDAWVSTGRSHYSWESAMYRVNYEIEMEKFNK